MKPGMFMSGCQRNPRFEQLRMADDISRPGPGTALWSWSRAKMPWSSRAAQFKEGEFQRTIPIQVMGEKLKRTKNKKEK